MRWQNNGKLSEKGGNPINGSVCLPSMYHTSPAQRDFSVVPVLLLPMEVLLSGGWKGKGHVNLLFAFQSFMPDQSSH